MITLNNPNHILQVLLSGAITTNQAPVSIGYSEGEGTRARDKSATSQTNSGTAVDLLTGSRDGRKVKEFNLYNADTVAITATIRIKESASVLRTLQKVTLQTGESLVYNEQEGWYATDVNGNRKTNQPASSGASSTADSKGDSAATRASVADSKVVSISTVASTNLSVGDSKAASNSANVSTVLSRCVSRSGC